MTERWDRACTAFKTFIKAHPEIKLETNRLSIPADVREEFWRLFEAVGEAFFLDYFPVESSEIDELSRNYTALKKELIGQLGLTQDQSCSPLETFLTRPSSAFIKGKQSNAFIKFFNGSEDFPSLKMSAADTVKSTFLPYCHSGYENWVVLSLLKTINPVRLMEVNFCQVSPTYILDYSPVEIPDPTEIKNFSLLEKPQNLVMPIDLIADTGGLFVGFKLNAVSFHNSRRPALFKDIDRSWVPNKAIGRVVPGMTLLYTGNSPAEISLVSDNQRIFHPDAVLECRWQSGWLNQKSLSDIKARSEALKPRLGTFIVSNEKISEETFNECLQQLKTIALPSGSSQSNRSNVALLNTGFETTKLQPLADAIMKS